MQRKEIFSKGKRNVFSYLNLFKRITYFLYPHCLYIYFNFIKGVHLIKSVLNSMNESNMENKTLISE